jgi:RNA recognition motif-containing protein
MKTVEILSLSPFSLPSKFVAHIPLYYALYIFFHTVEEREFLDFFQRFGEVIDSVVMVDRLTKRSRGFGFVTFADEVRKDMALH